jgi:hypothetical protein
VAVIGHFEADSIQKLHLNLLKLLPKGLVGVPVATRGLLGTPCSWRVSLTAWIQDCECKIVGCPIARMLQPSMRGTL